MNEDEQTKEMIVIEAQTTLDENHAKIVKRDASKVFPIPQTLRKKLELLKEKSLGDIETQVRVIKQQKEDEFVRINKIKTDKAKAEIAKLSAKLTKKAHQIMIAKRKEDEKVLAKYKGVAQEFYKEVDALHVKFPEVLIQQESYDFPLKRIKDREIRPAWELAKQAEEDKDAFSIKLDEKKFNDKFLKKDFDEKFGEGFNTARQKIRELEKQFDEALLFGDMEIVKQVYYNLRNAEKFLETLNQVKFN